MSDFFNKKITVANLTTLIRVFIFGILSAEFWYFAKAISLRINQYLESRDLEYFAIIFCISGFLLLIIYLINRDLVRVVKKLLQSMRFDVFLAFLFGIFISIFFNGIGTVLYIKILSNISARQLIILSTIPFILLLLLFLRAIQVNYLSKKRKEESFFVSDLEQKTEKDDLLDFSDEVEVFAERIFNRGSSDSIVFGIDAPWGVGKSTFVNLCKEYLENKHKDDVLIYSFNPLRYEDRTNLLEKFVDGLIRIIRKDSFVPEIKPLISKYSRLIKGIKGSFSIFGFELFSGTYTIDDAFKDLEMALLNFNKKIIVIVDDLDRLNFSSIKNVLFSIKKSFTLPNVSYVLCYDTENINALEKERPDIEKITEFLEKFVNVKISLYLDSKVLQKYVSENLTKILAGNSQADPILVSKVVGGLIGIYESKDYHRYIAFIGDARKIKRLINTLLLLEIEKVDFENSDFNNQDLIHLILIYINYPSIFRRIYNTETHGRRGFFSVVMPYDDDYPKDSNQQAHLSNQNSVYKNSVKYTKYLKSLTENQKFLLNKVFEVDKRLETTVIDSVSQEIKHSYACFNGGWTDGKNLEEYLNLIIRMSKPQKHSQYRFYLNCKNEIIKGKSVEDVLSKDEFLYSGTERTHEQFWRVIINSLYEFDSQTGTKLIDYLLNNIQNYSLFTNKDIGVGLRYDLNFFLVKLLDVVGWVDQSGGHRHNTEENLVEIAEWIFGEGRHKDNSVIEVLSKEDRGVLGLYDLLSFRLFCSADRGGDIFNLQRALSKHDNPKAPTSGLVRDIVIEEMREISQKVFTIFKTQYIDQNKNIFDLVNSLTLTDLTGKYYQFVKGKIDAGEIKNADEEVKSLKSRIKSFTIYQLGNSFISHGVGCGYYDVVGKEDKNGIKTEINKYLFGKCFNPEEKGQAQNYEHFLDYLLINFASVFASDHGRDYIPSIDEFTKVLEKEKLAKYWKDNRQAIKALNLIKKEKKIFAGNYKISYKENLDEIYQLLDKFVQDYESETKKEL